MLYLLEPIDVTKPNKKNGLALVCELEIVKAALRRHAAANSAIAPAPAIEAPQISPVEINRGSIGSVASSILISQPIQGEVVMLADPDVGAYIAVPIMD